MPRLECITSPFGMPQLFPDFHQKEVQPAISSGKHPPRSYFSRVEDAPFINLQRHVGFVAKTNNFVALSFYSILAQIDGCEERNAEEIRKLIHAKISAFSQEEFEEALSQCLEMYGDQPFLYPFTIKHPGRAWMSFGKTGVEAIDKLRDCGMEERLLLLGQIFDFPTDWTAKQISVELLAYRAYEPSR